MRADRLLRLMVLLQRHRRLPAGDLAARLEVSTRTILRDMEALSAAGVPVYTERGRHGGCVLLDTFTTDATGLTAAEAQALFAWSARGAAEQLGLGAELSGALAKIAVSASTTAVAEGEAVQGVLVDDRRRWFAAAEAVPFLPLLRQAAVAGRRVRMTYAGAGRSEARRRTVDPWGLVDHAGQWYLIAARQGEARTYRVSRIASATVLDEPWRTPPDRPLDDVWSQLRKRFETTVADPVTIDVRVGHAVARQFISIAQMQVVAGSTATPLGGDVWRLATRDRRSALGLVMAWAPEVELVGPAELVAEVTGLTAALTTLYSSPPAGSQLAST